MNIHIVMGSCIDIIWKPASPSSMPTKKWSLTQRNKLVIYAGKINKGKKVKYEGVVSRNSE